MSLRPRQKVNSDAIQFRDGLVLGNDVSQVQTLRQEINNLAAHTHTSELLKEQNSKLDSVLTHVSAEERISRRISELEALVHTKAMAQLEREPHKDKTMRSLSELERKVSSLCSQLPSTNIVGKVAQLETKLSDLEKQKEDMHRVSALGKLAELESKVSQIAVREKNNVNQDIVAKLDSLASNLKNPNDHVINSVMSKLDKLESRLDSKFIHHENLGEPKAKNPESRPLISVDAWVNERMRVDMLQSKLRGLNAS